MSEHTMITEKQSPKPQKVKWRNVAYYNNYQEADSYRASLVDELKVKVRKCGPNGSKFVVKVGTVIKTDLANPTDA